MSLLLLSLVSRRTCASGPFVFRAVSYFSIFEGSFCSCARWQLTLISEARRRDGRWQELGWCEFVKW